MLRSARNIKTIASAGLHRRFFASAGRRRVPVFNLDNDTPKGSALVMAFQSPLNKNPQQNSGGAGSPTSVAATASGESTSVLSNGCGCTDAQGKVIAPLRVATSSTGISKAHAKLTPAWNGQMTYSWDPVELENLATEDIDHKDLCGEDALSSGYVGKSGRLSPSIPRSPLDTSNLTSFFNPFPSSYKPVPVQVVSEPVTASVSAVADGVGGMVAHGTANQTALMSHALVRNVRNALSSYSVTSTDVYADPEDVQPKDLMQNAWHTLCESEEVAVGSTTLVVGTIAPLRATERMKQTGSCGNQTCSKCTSASSVAAAGSPVKSDADAQTQAQAETEGGIRGYGNYFDRYVTPASRAKAPCQGLQFRFANVGDSSIVAFRPPFLQTSPTAKSTKKTTSTSTSTAATEDMDEEEEDGETGGMNDADGDAERYISPSSVKYVSPSVAVPLAHSWVLHHSGQTDNPPPGQLTIQPFQPRAIQLLKAGRGLSDEPWMAQEGSAVLQRGDVVVTMSDGIGDNLTSENLVIPLSGLYLHVISHLKDLSRYSSFLPSAKAINSKLPVEREKGDKPSAEEEAFVAGNISAIYAGTIVRYAQQSYKIDDLSVVVNIVF